MSYIPVYLVCKEVHDYLIKLIIRPSVLFLQNKLWEKLNEHHIAQISKKKLRINFSGEV